MKKDYKVDNMNVIAMPNSKPYIMNESQLSNIKKKQYKLDLVKEIEKDFYYIIEIYHDGVLIDAEKYNFAYPDNFKCKNRVEELEKQDYARIY